MRRRRQGHEPEPQGSPRGQGPPRFRSCIAVRRCLLLEEKVPSIARRMRCFLTLRTMAIPFLHRSTSAAADLAEMSWPPPALPVMRPLSNEHRIRRGVPPRHLPLKGKAFRAHPGPGLCPTSSLVCFCITCQEIFLSARKPASAPCAARISRTAQPPSRTRPQRCTRTGPIRRKTGFPQSFHRLFHNSSGFPQRLSFPLAFFERDRVRYAGSVGSFCGVGYGTVPRYFCATSRVTGGPRHSGHIQSQTR